MDEIQMPQYECHKKVWALKIKKIEPVPAKENHEASGDIIITPEEEGYAPFIVPYSYVSKHSPEKGGYFVVYEDGYKSFSPAKAFENGYTKITN